MDLKAVFKTDKTVIGMIHLGDFPTAVGAGITAETCREQRGGSDGAIVGSCFRKDGRAENELDPQRVERFMAQVRSIRCYG